jgi:hypothetical protein
MTMTESFFQRSKKAARILIKGTPPAKQIRSSIPPISAEEVVEAKLFFPMTKFFIYGHARSGTTLLARLIRLHPQVHCNWQAHFFTRAPMLKSLVSDPEVEKWLSARSNRWNRGRDLSPVVMRAAADFILERDARREGKTITGDKSPSSLMNGEAVSALHDIYPDAYLINIVRDGRDTTLSHRFQSFVDREDQLSPADRRIRADFIAHPEPFLTGQRSIFTEKELASSAQSWVKNVTETEQEGRGLFGDHYYSFRYEDLMAQPWEEMCKIWHFLDAEGFSPELQQIVADEMNANPDAEWQAEKSSDLARLVPKGQQGSWRSIFTVRDRQIYKEIAGQLIFDWQYEKDMEW